MKINKQGRTKMENTLRLSNRAGKTSSLVETSKADSSYAKLMGTVVSIHIVAIYALYNLGMFLAAAN